jgi:N-acetylmuramoyl-L-alanine amidase
MIGLLAFGALYTIEIQAKSIGVVADEFAEAYVNPWLGATITAFFEEGEVIDIDMYSDGCRMFIHTTAITILQAEGLVMSHGSLLLTEPSPFSEVSSTVQMGSILNVIGFFGDYFAVDLGASTAYIHRNDILGGFLGYLQEYGPTPFVLNLDWGHRHYNNLLITANDYLTVTGTVEGLNLRAMPNSSAHIIKCIPNGNKLEIVELGRDWHQVSYNGETGYVSARFTSFADEFTAERVAAAFAQNDLAHQIVANAKQYLGVRYTWGGTSASTGFDCSGFVYTVYKSVGITLNRASRDQIRNGTIVSKNDLQPGDLVFFATGGGSRISHVGIYIGGGDFIHSSTSNRRGVIVSSLSETYYARTYVNACRIIK